MVLVLFFVFRWFLGLKIQHRVVSSFLSVAFACLTVFVMSFYFLISYSPRITIIESAQPGAQPDAGTGRKLTP
jgi:heme/copper-type cytochrome/quinol oxidase subunit 2